MTACRCDVCRNRTPVAVLTDAELQERVTYWSGQIGAAEEALECGWPVLHETWAEQKRRLHYWTPEGVQV